MIAWQDERRRGAMKLSYLIKGFPGHPLHPPLTDATIGAYTVAFVLALLGILGVAEDRMATGWWLALIAESIATAPSGATPGANDTTNCCATAACTPNRPGMTTSTRCAQHAPEQTGR